MKRNSKKVPILGLRAGFTTVKQLINEHFIMLNYHQFNHLIMKFIKVIQKYQLEEQSTIGIFSQNSPAWLAIDLAIGFTNNVTVPIYTAISMQQIIYCLNLAQVKILFLSQQQQKYVPVLLEQVPTLKQIFVVNDQYEMLKEDIENKIMYESAQLYCQFTDVGEVYENEVCSMYSISSTLSTNSQQNNTETQIDPKIINEIKTKLEEAMNQLKFINLSLDEILSVDEKTIQDETKQLNSLEQKIDCKNINSITFTSGTSGSNPKGAIHSHQTFVSGLNDLTYRLVQRIEEKNIDKYNEIGVYRHLSFLPLAHIFERGFEYVCIRNGITIYFGTQNTKNLMTDLKISKPTIMIGVPRIYQKIYNEFNKKLKSMLGYQQKIFNIVYKLRLHEIKKLQKKNTSYYQNYGKIMKQVYQKLFDPIKQLFGGEMETIVISSSALPQHIREFIEVTTQAQIIPGYGMSECVSIALNYPGQYFNDEMQFGYICKGTIAKLIDRSDACEYSLKNDRIGEICIKSRGLCLGYIDPDKKYPNIINNKDEDGFYHTNDLCKLNDDGTPSFLRRVNMVTKLAQGEFVDIEMLETIIETIPAITCAIVYGDSKMNNPIVIVSCDKVVIDSLKLNGQDELQNYLLKEIDTSIRQKGLKGYNIPKQIKVYMGQEEKWMQNAELFTASQKKKHGSMYKYFSKDIKELQQQSKE